MDTITYQVFGVSFCGAHSQGFKGVDVYWDDADENSNCASGSASSTASLGGLPSDSVTFTNSYLKSDSDVDDRLDVPLEVIDLFVDYAVSSIRVYPNNYSRFRIHPRVYAVLPYHIAPMKAALFLIVYQTAILIHTRKSKSGEMGLADAKPNEIKELKDTLAKIDHIFGATGQDMTQFPTFKFDQPRLVHPHSTITAEYPEETEEVKEDQKAKDNRYILTI
ncbi:uncharacterized protein DEA37_0002069 [Paragonimus westermani]|uniref:Uncharacterized protein n=1 Tax=Paragonimus westermani TaxID=34504 RepID=A0A5J4NCM6_9TREM|nr:uncharacterized protein DEA37_0010661 [Paragonimus westermani]KAA3674043.1 uncharacterized protein DEA37_0002069 [Paragonimus westermani]